MRLRAAAVSAALLVARAKAQQVIQVSSAPYQKYSLTDILRHDSAMNCRGEVPSTLPKNCSGPYSGTGYVGNFVDACGIDYAVHCGMHIDSDPFAVYEDVPELSKCMEACDKFPNCTSATHLGSRCLLDANASMKAAHGHPELAALIKGSYRGMRMQTAPPSMVREYRRQASRTTVNPAAATVPVCPNSNGQLYEDDYGALYIISCGAYNTGTNYTILWSRDSGCTTLRCCMDYCDGFQDCFGTALLLGTNNNNCTFFYPPNGTHYANSAYNIAYQYRAANQPNLELANKYTDSYLYHRIICHGHANLVPHPNNDQRGHIDLNGGQQLLYNRGKHRNYKLRSDHNPKLAWDHRDIDTTSVNQYGHIYSTCKHEYSHFHSACKNDDPADNISLYVSYNGNLDRKNHGNIHTSSDNTDLHCANHSYIDAAGFNKHIDDYRKDHPDIHTGIHAAGVHKHIDNYGANHPNLYASGVDEYIDDHRKDHTDIHSDIHIAAVDKYIDNYGANHSDIHSDLDTTGVHKYINNNGKDHTNIHASCLSASVDKYSYPDRDFNALNHPKCHADLDIELAWHDSHHYIHSAQQLSLYTDRNHKLTRNEHTYETTEVITSVQPTTIISTYPITYTSLQNLTTTLSGPTLTETQRLTATNNVTATNTQTTTEQVPTYINQTTTLEGESIWISLIFEHVQSSIHAGTP
ncbi:hypothetical protein BTJ68_00685 [Hortaea werneckii EXF-2000]|uniref:Apple domain-containing protein n=1 Tax=Hortaea werneckii EXF-2000 TaxID=1157616 RepID=A0A1Z5TTJ7_HORWE|nr:hypothetical protein BTJ68_00685 [Hortaea werneckii EXF-2000]